MVDTLRSDRLSVWGASRPTSPAIDALAERGTRFANTHAVSTWTMPTVATLLTGLYPATHSVVALDRALPSEAESLPKLFSAAGYTTCGIVSHILISSFYGFAQGFDFFDSSQAGGHPFVSTPGVTKLALEVLSDFADSEEPFFLFVHFFDPHFDYLSHPEYGFAGEPVGRITPGVPLEELRRIQDQLTPEESAHLLALYDEEVRFTDDGIGRIVAALEELGLDDSTIVVVTADHGEELGEHGWIGHLTSMSDEVLNIPLVIVDPRIESPTAVVDQRVSQASIAPTIADLVGLDWKQPAPRAKSLAGFLTGAPPSALSPVLFDVDYRGSYDAEDKALSLSGLLEGNVWLLRNEDTGTSRLRRLDSSAGERVVADAPSELARLEQQLDRWLEEQAAGGLPPTLPSLKNLDPDMLRELGYTSVEEQGGH